MRSKKLRSGYTTGACSAAAAKAAVELLLKARRDNVNNQDLTPVEIPFPDGSRVAFALCGGGADQRSAWASVIKDAGDDPDVTNGAEIRADVKIVSNASDIIIRGGKGVGVITKPGLSMPVGEAAINPVPRKMIRDAVREANAAAYQGKGDCPGFIGAAIESGLSPALHTPASLEITISVPKGEELAKKTLNSRLGILGGISILGTTGIVRPLSTEAWTASITSAMDVARAASNDEIVLSAGRMSEKAHMKKFGFPEEAYVMMGDYLAFSLKDAAEHGFGKIHLCAQWAKMLKIALSTPQTHVRHGVIEVKRGAALLNTLGIAVPGEREFNTAREVFDFIRTEYGLDPLLLGKVCRAARRYAVTVVGSIPVVVHLVSYEGEIIADSE